jgi:hypothetical protein
MYKDPANNLQNCPVASRFDADLNGRQNRCRLPAGVSSDALQPVNMDVGAANTDAFFTYETRFGAF